jgi:hypothetical protein
MALATLATVVALAGLAGCDDTTGVELQIHSTVAADHVLVTATSALGPVMHTLVTPSGGDWTLQFVATFRADIGAVTFTATPLLGAVAVANCPARSVNVAPHRVVSATLDCSATTTGASGYFAAVLADQPIAYYHLGDTAASGTSAVDATGNRLDGTYGATVARQRPSLLADAAATADGAAGFPGGAANAGNSVRAAGVVLAPKTALSVELWLTSAGGNQAALPLQYDFGPGQIVPIYSLSLQSNHLVFYVHAGGKTVQSTITSAATIVNGQAYHVVGTYDETAQSMSLWVDGALDTTLAGNNGDVIHGDAPTSGLGIGGSYNDASAIGWNGVIDEVAIYGTALSAGRIQAHYASGTTK